MVNQNIKQQMSDDLDESIKRIQLIGTKFTEDLVQSNEPWQYVVRAHAYIDMSLGHAIQISLKNPSAIKDNEYQGMNFPLKLSLVEGLGIITLEEKSVYLRFNNIRNIYGHNPIAVPSLADEMKIYDTMPKHMRESLLSTLKKKGISESEVSDTYKTLRREISKAEDESITAAKMELKPKYLKEISILLLGFIWGKVASKELEKSITKALMPGISAFTNSIMSKKTD
jgi:hypothetical protein